jgi:CBS domain-containing protein
MHDDYVFEWMSSPPITAAPTMSLAAAQRLMEQRRVRRLPVIEDGRLVGIITRGDLRAAHPSSATSLSVYETSVLLDQVPIATCMTRNPLTILADAPILDVARQMLAARISGMPVVDGEQVVGVITESDLFRMLLGEVIGVDHADGGRHSFTCRHCGTVSRRRSFDTLGPDDECWRCHYHLHRCDNCRYFDAVGCMIDRMERHTPIPGRYCPAFSAWVPRTSAVVSGS